MGKIRINGNLIARCSSIDEHTDVEVKLEKIAAMLCLDPVIRAIPQLRFFCCHSSLRTGCLIVGWIHVICGLIMEYVTVTGLIDIDSKKRVGEFYEYLSHDLAENCKQNLFIVHIHQGMLALMNTAHTVAAILLLIGVVQKSTKNMKLWLIAQIIFITVLTFQTAAMVVFNERDEGFGHDCHFQRALRLLVSELMAFWVFYGVSLYAISIVKSYYEEVKEIKEERQGILMNE